MSINRLISIKNPIINAFDKVGVDRAKDLPVFTTWAIQAEKEIGSHYALVKEKKVLDIHGCKAELPCNAVYLQFAIMGVQDCSCNDLRSLCSTNTFANEIADNTGSIRLDFNSFLIVDQVAGGGVGIWNNVQYEIQGNQIVFYQNLDGQSVTIQYIGYKLDEDGFPMVSENHVRAITEYIEWQYCSRSKYSSNPLPDNLIQEHKREWFRLCSHARAEDAIPSPSEQSDIAQILNDPYSGRSVSDGMMLVQWNRLW